MYNRHDPEERQRVEKVVYDMVDRALEMEGSCTVSYLDTSRSDCMADSNRVNMV